MPLGYDRWQPFAEAVGRAQHSLTAAGQDVAVHIKPYGTDDFRLTREGAYGVVQNCNPGLAAVAEAQAYFRDRTMRYEQGEVARDLSSLDVLVAVATELRDQDRRIRATEDRQHELEAKVSAMAGEYMWTALAFARRRGIPGDPAYLSQLGKLATQISRSRGIEPGQVQDARFGYVNSYPLDVLVQALEAMF